jgi:CHAT domain-containing protein
MASTVTADKPLLVADPDFNLGGQPDTKPAEIEFSPLPGTRLEAKLAAGMVPGCNLWLREQALLGRLQRECHSPRVLVLATHGFFLESGEDAEVVGRLREVVRQSPLLRSGLVLAGANTWLRHGQPPGEAGTGLLTAEAVAGLDLLATELVVLSACETGLGEVVFLGEGIFGLRRAFQVAGARTVVMSLWKVDDLATLILMERFYANVLKQQMPRDEALREAQLFTRQATVGQLRQRWLLPRLIPILAADDPLIRADLERLAAFPDAYRPFELPYFWGAFISQGDPTPLPCVTVAEPQRG